MNWHSTAQWIIRHSKHPVVLAKTFRCSYKMKIPGGTYFCPYLSLVSAQFSSVQFTSVTQLCLTLCDPMDCSTPGFHAHHQCLELTQTHVHWVGDAIQPSYPLLCPSPPTFNPSQHQGLFKWVNSSHQMAKVLEFQLHHQSFQWIFRTDFL